MARSDYVTMIPLDRAAKIIGIDPYHFNGIVTLRRPENNACDDVWFQSADQRQGQLGRDDLAIALRQAEKVACDYLGYFLIPWWVQDEEKVVTRPANVDVMNVSGLNAGGRPKSVVTSKGWVIEGGRKARSVIEEGSAVTYSDDNGDGYDELATVSVATTVTEPQEIHVFFPGKSGKDTWEIKPVDVSISGGVATITFPRYLAPLPSLWTNEPEEGDVWRTINGDDDSSFLEVVDVYRVYNDPSGQATFYREGCTCESCGGDGCSACNWSTNTGCLRVRDSRRGIVTYTAAVWNEDDEEFDFSSSPCWSEPDKLKISYRSGIINNDLDYPYLQMEPAWERMIVFYALTLLDRELNGCENTHNIWKMMNNDLSKQVSSQSGSTSFQVTNRDLGNPLGPKFAAIRLWRMIESNRLLQGR